MSNRLPALDGLRGLAALVVVLFHGLLIVPGLARPYGPDPQAGDPGWLAQTPLHLLWAGTEAVYVFFLLSGFVLSLPFVRGPAPSRAVWLRYYPQRLVRLYLPVVGSIVLALLLAAVVPRQERSGLSWWWNGHAEETTASGLLRDLTLVAGNTWLNSPLWSLRWEVLFSLLLPLYVLAVRWTRRVWWLAPGAALVVCAVGSAASQALFYLSMFAVGAAAAAHRDALVRRVSSGGPRLWWALVVLGVGLLQVRWTVPQVPVTAFVAFLGAGLVFLLFLGARPAVRLGTSRPVAWAGTVSFSLYLVHVPVLLLVGRLLLDHVVPGADAVHLAVLTLVVGFPASLLVAAGFHRAVERPSHRLAQHVGQTVASWLPPGSGTIPAARRPGGSSAPELATGPGARAVDGPGVR